MHCRNKEELSLKYICLLFKASLTILHTATVSQKKVGLAKLEDLKVLKRSPDLLNNVKIGQGQLRLILQTYFAFV